MNELKPCPFCGSAGREVIRFYEEGAATSIRCQTCKVVTAPFLHIPEAVSAWDTRPGEDKLRQQRDELARMVLAVAYPVGMSQHVCQLCLGVRGAHADGCPAARATAHLQEGK